jgi:AraC family transcriptional regulator
MAYIRRLHPMKDWEGTFEKPKFLLSSVGQWGADFHEVQYGPYGSWDVDVTLLHVSALLTPTRQRHGPERSPLRLMAPSWAMVVPGQSMVGGWSGAMRGRHLFLTMNEVERIVDAPVRPSVFQPRPFAAQSDAVGDGTMAERLLDLLAADVKLGSPSGPVFAQSVLSALLHHLMAGSDGSPRVGAVTRRDWQVALVIDRIHANIAARLSLTDLAVEVGVSVQYLCRIFKRATGLTPHQYILHERVARARTLIASGHLPLADIAHAVGFADQSQMTTTFRNVLGVTPSVFRPPRGGAPENGEH